MASIADPSYSLRNSTAKYLLNNKMKEVSFQIRQSFYPGKVFLQGLKKQDTVFVKDLLKMFNICFGIAHSLTYHENDIVNFALKIYCLTSYTNGKALI